MAGHGGADNAQAQNFGYGLRRIDGAVDAKVRELIGGEALGVQGAEALLVAKERAAGHGHAAAEEEVGGGIEPQDGDARGAEKFGAAGLRVSAAAESEDRAGWIFGGAAEGGTELVGLCLAEGGFAEALEELRDGDAGGSFNAFVEVDEAPGELAGEQGADGGFAGAHETGEAKDLWARQ